MNVLRPGAARACLLPALVLLAGCGGGATGTVAGTVSSKSKNRKLVCGTVMVIGRNGAACYGTINPDGTYRVDNVPTGPARVTVSSPDPGANPNAGHGPAAPGVPGKPTRGAAPAALPAAGTRGWFPIPDRYGDANASGLSVEVKKGDNALNIDLD